MQTFMPYPDFAQSAKVLDDKRLYKQIVEAKQILRAIQDVDYGWQNHPAVNMWRGYEDALINYSLEMFREWYRRRWLDSFGSIGIQKIPNAKMPPWVGHEPFHESHRLNLVYKDPDQYSIPFNIEVLSDKPEYVWPSKMEEFKQ